MEEFKLLGGRVYTKISSYIRTNLYHGVVSILPMRGLVESELIIASSAPTGSEMELSPTGIVCEESSMYVAWYLIPNAASAIADL